MTDRGVLLKRNGRIGFTLAFIASGIAHFLSPRLFIALIPKRVPGRPFLDMEPERLEELWYEGWSFELLPEPEEGVYPVLILGPDSSWSPVLGEVELSTEEQMLALRNPGG